MTSEDAATKAEEQEQQGHPAQPKKQDEQHEDHNHHAADARVTRMGTESIPKLITEFAIPAIAGTLVNAAYNLIDSIFLGNAMGEIGLAGEFRRISHADLRAAEAARLGFTKIALPKRCIDDKLPHSAAAIPLSGIYDALSLLRSEKE